MKQNKLLDALNAFFAYDVGCTDSGISDPVLRAKVEAELGAMTDTQKEELKDTYIKKFLLNDEAIAQGFGDEDVEEFKEWFASF